MRAPCTRCFIALALLPATTAADAADAPEAELASTPLQLETQVEARKNPLLAAGLAFLLPGAGQAYLGNWAAAAGYAGATFGQLGLAVAFALEDQNAPATATGTYASPGLSLLMLNQVQTVSLYGIYAAYRDARLYNHNAGYAVAIPDHDLTTYLLSPFAPEVLRKPEVWLGLIAAVLFVVAYDAGVKAALTALHFAPQPARPLWRQSSVRVLGSDHSRLDGAALSTALNGVLSMQAAMGEEALYRGVLQSELRQHLGPWPALAASSSVFAAMHIANTLLQPDAETRAGQLLSLPGILLVGSYMGWIFERNGHSLRESIAFHFWYDVIAMGLGLLINPKSTAFTMRIGFAF